MLPAYLSALGEDLCRSPSPDSGKSLKCIVAGKMLETHPNTCLCLRQRLLHPTLAWLVLDPIHDKINNMKHSTTYAVCLEAQYTQIAAVTAQLTTMHTSYQTMTASMWPGSQQANPITTKQVSP